MPIYCYKCKKCGAEIELLEGVTQEKIEKICPECGSREFKRVFSSFGVGKSSANKPKQRNSSCSSCCPGGACPYQ